MYSGQPTKRTTNVRSQRSLPDRIVITNAETVFGRPFVISCSIPVRRLSDIGKGGIGNPNPLAATIPESVYICFQMTFAIITPALIAGAFAERMKFSAMLWFVGLWAIFVYAPIAHWVWGLTGSWLPGTTPHG